MMNYSAYPDEKYDRHGIPRIKATETALPWTYRHLSRMMRGLAISLACYVSEDDATLRRREFLEMIRDRIELDLETGEY